MAAKRQARLTGESEGPTTSGLTRSDKRERQDAKAVSDDDTAGQHGRGKSLS